MAKKALPRKTSIRGQRHLLAYITPDEAALLKARGGTGELHKGIPSYPPSAKGGSGLDGSGGGGYEGGGGGGGMKDDSGGSKEKFDSGYTVTKSFAEKKIDAQIKKGKKNIQKMTALEKVLAAVVPGAGFKPAQDLAAQYMGSRFKNILKEEGSRAVVSPTTGRVEGVYDAAGRLTGRDSARDRQRAAEMDKSGGGGVISPLFGGTGLDEENNLKPKKAKKVIRTDLAIETEAERLKRRKAGASQLANRSLLANVSKLGA